MHLHFYKYMCACMYSLVLIIRVSTVPGSVLSSRLIKNLFSFYMRGKVLVSLQFSLILYIPLLYCSTTVYIDILKQCRIHKR